MKTTKSPVNLVKTNVDLHKYDTNHVHYVAPVRVNTFAAIGLNGCLISVSTK